MGAILPLSISYSGRFLPCVALWYLLPALLFMTDRPDSGHDRAADLGSRGWLMMKIGKVERRLGYFWDHLSRDRTLIWGYGYHEPLGCAQLSWACVLSSTYHTPGRAWLGLGKSEQNGDKRTDTKPTRFLRTGQFTEQSIIISPHWTVSSNEHSRSHPFHASAI